MRLKLLVIASLAAVAAGAGGSALLLYLLTGRPGLTSNSDWPGLVAPLLPLAAITYASVFVYRRTARRRRLQAALTALASLALTLALYFAFVVFTTCCDPPLEQTPPAPSKIS